MFEDAILKKRRPLAPHKEQAPGDLHRREIIIFLCVGIVTVALLTAHYAGVWPFRPLSARLASQAERATGLPASDAGALVQTFRQAGLLLRDEGSRYWVSSPLWYRLDALAKERVCMSLYTWRMAQGEQLPVTILDAQSGATLATYDSWSGLQTR
jgi:hypothetical protein